MVPRRKSNRRVVPQDRYYKGGLDCTQAVGRVLLKWRFAGGMISFKRDTRNAYISVGVTLCSVQLYMHSLKLSKQAFIQDYSTPLELLLF